MTTLREAAQQALEALVAAYQGKDKQGQVTDAITALRAALAEPVQDKRTTVADLRDAMWLDPECADKGACQSLKFKCPAEPEQEPTRSERMRAAGMTRRPRGWIKDGDEPVQEPVAWIHADPDKPGLKFLEWREDAFGYEGEWTKTPLYTAPPQHKPLTDEVIERNWELLYDETGNIPDYHDFARAIERAHGIGGSK